MNWNKFFTLTIFSLPLTNLSLFLLKYFSRYGCTSATKLSNSSLPSCSDRTTLTANDNNDGNTHKLYYENRWEPPLIAAPHGVTIGKLGGGGHYASSPKLWPSQTNLPDKKL